MATFLDVDDKSFDFFEEILKAPFHSSISFSPEKKLASWDDKNI